MEEENYRKNAYDPSIVDVIRKELRDAKDIQNPDSELTKLHRLWARAATLCAVTITLALFAGNMVSQWRDVEVEREKTKQAATNVENQKLDVEHKKLEVEHLMWENMNLPQKTEEGKLAVEWLMWNKLSQTPFDIRAACVEWSQKTLEK